jgi:hypothetical protein
MLGIELILPQKRSKLLPRRRFVRFETNDRIGGESTSCPLALVHSLGSLTALG